MCIRMTAKEQATGIWAWGVVTVQRRDKPVKDEIMLPTLLFTLLPSFKSWTFLRYLSFKDQQLADSAN